jgi:hypothetical protein
MRLVTAVQLRETQNTTLKAWEFGLWTLPEFCMGFVAACVPVTPRFFQETGLHLVLRRWLCCCLGRPEASTDGRTHLIRPWHGSLSTGLGGTGKMREGFGGSAIPLGSVDHQGPPGGPRSSDASLMEDYDEVPPLLQAYGITKTVEISTSVSARPEEQRSWYNPRGHWEFDMEPVDRVPTTR